MQFLPGQGAYKAGSPLSPGISEYIAEYSPGISKYSWGPLRAERRECCKTEEAWIPKSRCGGLSDHQGHLPWTAKEANNKLDCIQGLKSGGGVGDQQAAVILTDTVTPDDTNDNG